MTYKNRTLAYIEKNLKKTYLPLFKEYKKNWNLKIREAHRQNLGLKSRSDNIKIEFASINEIDESRFNNIFETKYPNLDLQKLNTFKKFRDVSLDIDTHNFFDERYIPSLDLELRYVNDYINQHNIDAIIDDILDASDSQQCYDVLGTYIPDKCLVVLYYIPIISMSMLLNIDIEYLFMVVLTHELAHGYHHLGTDIDDNAWDRFEITKNDLVEPLAQYYTELIVKKEEQGYYNSFSELMKRQNKDYQYHTGWMNKYDREMIRNALIAIRRKRNPTIAEFEEILTKQKKLLGYQKKTTLNF